MTHQLDRSTEDKEGSGSRSGDADNNESKNSGAWNGTPRAVAAGRSLTMYDQEETEDLTGR